MTTALPIRVEVPVCAFRPYASREYQDTFPVPAPSSVYGMLLSLLGVPREEKHRHRGAEMAIAVAELPGRSKVFRKLRRGELDRKKFPHLSEEERILASTRPDYQDVLMDLTLWVWLRPGTDAGDPPLSSHVPAALSPPYAVTRFGGLSLGESSYLVDVIAVDRNPPADLSFVVPDKKGFYSLPVWVDHLNSANTVLNRFRITDPAPVVDTLPLAWFRIGG